MLSLAPLPSAADVSEAPLSCLEGPTDAIKVLDLLTNRYHLGLVRESSHAALRVELPASSHLHAGQRVRFVVAGRQALVSKMAMQRAFITNVSPHLTNRLNVQLALLPESAVA